MNEEVKKKWIEALRNGGYEQGRDRLRNEDSFCCLGVLCDISDQGSWNEEGIYITKTDEGSHVLPYEVAQWAEVDNSPATPAGKLFVLNDEGMSFERIADIIEKYL